MELGEKLDQETALDIKKGFSNLALDFEYSRRLKETFDKAVDRGVYWDGYKMTCAYTCLLVDGLRKEEISAEEFMKLMLNMAEFWLLFKGFYDGGKGD